MSLSPPIRLLITAAGGDLAQSIVKALRCSELPLWIGGGDMQADHAGSAFCEVSHLLPAAAASEYRDCLEALVKQHGYQAVIPASEPEIQRLCRDCPDRRLAGNVPILAQDADWLALHADKLHSMAALAPHIPLAPFADGADRQAVEALVAAAGFPLVVKPRRSSGSRNIAVVTTGDELPRALAHCPDAIVQAWIDDSGGEFSVATYRRSDELALLAFRRKLGATGCSWYAETVTDPQVLAYARQIAVAADLRGSANIQLRLSRRGPLLLEINPRYSSLVAARAAAGFRDVEWDLRQALALPMAPLPTAFRHLRFQRFYHELIDTGEGYFAPAPWQPHTASLPH